MGRIRETDYHHGSLTAVLLNEGYNLMLLETHESRRSYRITNNIEDYIVYAKYSSAPSSRGRNNLSATWSFSFADEEVTKIKGYRDLKENCLVALIASYNNAPGGELVMLSMSEFLKCIGDGWKVENPRIAVRKEKHRQVKVYGTGLDSKDAFIPRGSIAVTVA